jgi:hypothetical protein
MPMVSLQDLKEKFQTGDIPTAEDFIDLIDSCYNYSLSAYYLSGGQ